MNPETKVKYEKFKEDLKHHSLEDLERIIDPTVNSRSMMDPLFYNTVNELIRWKKCNPIVFIRYYWQWLLPTLFTLAGLVISLIEICK